MPKVDRWRKALAISALVHCLLLAGAGLLGGNLIKAAQVPDLIEVKLISDPGRSERQDNLAATTPVAAADRPFERNPAAIEKPAVMAEKTGEAVAESLSSSAAAHFGDSGAVVAGSAPSPGGGGPAAPKRIAAPRLLARTEPLYPEEARQAGAEGTVAVRIEIKENGQPGDIIVTRSSGRASFDAAAMESIRSWRFVPAQEVETGRAVRSYTTVAVVFKLNT